MKKKLLIIFLTVICVVSLTSLSVLALGKKSKTKQPAQVQVKKEKTLQPLEVKKVDFAPYLRDVQMSIKQNWNPPKGNESKRVVLLFTIGKDGSLQKYKVLESSNLDVMDEAALKALKATAPFKPLPAEFEDDSIDIQFSFDYNVHRSSSY